MADREAPAASPDSDVVYGALARAEALKAGYPRWLLVTRWPTTPESEESLHLDGCTLPADHEGDCNA